MESKVDLLRNRLEQLRYLCEQKRNEYISLVGAVQELEEVIAILNQEEQATDGG
jgi:hypothetical protein